MARLPTPTELAARGTARGLQAAAPRTRPRALSSQVIYLRQLKDLRALSLSGNPIAEAEDYRMFVWAYLPDLVYLDSRRIDDHMAGVSLWVPALRASLQGPWFRGKGPRGRDGHLPPPLTCLGWSGASRALGVAV